MSNPVELYTIIDRWIQEKFPIRYRVCQAPRWYLRGGHAIRCVVTPEDQDGQFVGIIDGNKVKIDHHVDILILDASDPDFFLNLERALIGWRGDGPHEA